jgi:hypothetical protein
MRKVRPRAAWSKLSEGGMGAGSSAVPLQAARVTLKRIKSEIRREACRLYKVRQH